MLYLVRLRWPRVVGLRRHFGPPKAESPKVDAKMFRQTVNKPSACGGFFIAQKLEGKGR
jgi:hypothetical protein